MAGRLIQFDAETIGKTYLDDFLTIVAYNIEDAFIAGGAMPGKDYSYKDLYQLAAPFAIEKAKTGHLKWKYKEFEGPLFDHPTA